MDCFPSAPYENGIILRNTGVQRRNHRYTSFEARLWTFKRGISSFPHSHPTHREFVEAGFYFTGVGDVVTCYECGGSLRNWKSSNTPLVEHKIQFPHCKFLKFKCIPGFEEGVSNPDIIKEAKEIIPPEIVDKVQANLEQKKKSFSSLHQLLEEIVQYNYNENKPSQPEQCKEISNPSMENGLLCQICMDTERNVVFQPCNHLITCSKCAILLSKCPLCRKEIEDRMKVFLG